ncbi:hypothetical protein QR680_002951 [Steinernema hermaphroditum]|uniref:Uncharacterized protein n=1 Tax=Steinernema hermaphroditum TaxID=289476 RepID=A0AA39LJD6_9BILA|nr:hypothetical protein QR680_002951 [Steinernema hermaphroditum]
MSGKTSMVKHLIGEEYPGSFIGPGPTKNDGCHAGDQPIVRMSASKKEITRRSCADEGRVHGKAHGDVFGSAFDGSIVRMSAKKEIPEPLDPLGTVSSPSITTMCGAKRWAPGWRWTTQCRSRNCIQSFLSKFRGATLSSPLLKHRTLLDIPGILADQNRNYDFWTRFQ